MADQLEEVVKEGAGAGGGAGHAGWEEVDRPGEREAGVEDPSGEREEGVEQHAV